MAKKLWVVGRCSGVGMDESVSAFHCSRPGGFTQAAGSAESGELAASRQSLFSSTVLVFSHMETERVKIKCTRPEWWGQLQSCSVCEFHLLRCPCNFVLTQGVHSLLSRPHRALPLTFLHPLSVMSPPHLV